MAQAVVFDLQGVLVTEQGYVVPGVVEFIATPTTCIPALFAACIPGNESSNAMHSAGGIPTYSAAVKYTSGSGLVFATSSAVTEAEISDWICN